MPMRYINSFIIVVVLYSFISCGKNTNTSNTIEGEIIYSIAYPNLDSNNIFFDMMPKTMDYTFSEDGTKSEISAGMGLFKSSYIKLTNSENLFQTVKILNKKYQSSYTTETFLALNPKYKGIAFEETVRDTLLNGYNCKVVKFNFPNDSTTRLVYYTTELGGENPNAGTPFERIPGVMLKYTIENFGVMMDFTADEITTNKIDKTTFEISKDYAEVSPKELKAQIEAIFLVSE